MYLIVVTHSEVHIQRVHFEPEAPVLIDLVLPNLRNEHGNLECEKGLFKSNVTKISILLFIYKKSLRNRSHKIT